MTMTRSQEIGAFAEALCKAQGSMGFAEKDSVNPHFRSRYPSLAACWDACRRPLADNGLSVTQGFDRIGDDLIVWTLLLHASGQWIETRCSTTPRDFSPQSIGSAVSYMKRYQLAAIVGLAADDDDGEAAQHQRARPATTATPTAVAQSQPATATIVAAFAVKGISEADIEAKIGKPLAQATDIDVATLRTWLAGLNNPKSTTANALAQAFRTGGGEK